MHYMILYALAGAYPGQVTFFPLTGDMEVEHDPFKAQSVVCCSRNLVDANFTVDMLDPVVDGAYIHIGYSGSITKVHCYTCHGAKTLAKEKKKYCHSRCNLGCLSAFSLTHNRVLFL